MRCEEEDGCDALVLALGGNMVGFWRKGGT